MKYLLSALLLCVAATNLLAQDKVAGLETRNVPYRTAATDEYAAQRCLLDLYLPAQGKGFATLVWFHGGGLENGDKAGVKKLGDSLAAEGIATVGVNYRLSPQVQFPAYVEDAAAATAWVQHNIAQYGGDPQRVFVGGHSAGGYLALMLALDPQYLKQVDSTPAGFIPVSGQTVTHYTVRKERGIGKFQVTVDSAGPLHFIRKTAPPLLIIAGENDMAGRVAENQLLFDNLKDVGAPRVQFLIVPDRDHGTINSKITEANDPARAAILKFLAPVAAAGTK